MPDPAQQIDALRRQIRHHDRKYYVDAAPEISDREYDRLVHKLRELEAAHPHLITSDSPSQRIGDAPVQHLASVPHRTPMLSIDNTYDLDELKRFGQRASKLLPEEDIAWVVELKIDGVAVSLVYEKGILQRAVTRGDGRVGDDITHNVRTMAGVPLRLAEQPSPNTLEVRGEVYMTNSDLVALNQRQASRGLPLFANTRNVTAGTIRMLDPRVCAERRLRVFCHGLGYCEGLKSTTYEQFLEEIQQYGLPVSPYVRRFTRFDGAVDYCSQLVGRLHELDFEVDGLVLKVDRFDQRERLGTTAKSPRWMVAYKFEKYQKTTRLRAIRVRVGKSGAVTPVAELEPVELAGTTVSRASLHNVDEIQRKDVRVGDVVLVEKAGKIIPHIVRVEKHERHKPLREFQFPTQCPQCGTALVKDEGGVIIRCPNPACPAQLKERIGHFASRGAMDIEGLGDKLVEQLVDRQLVRRFGDLYRLETEQLVNMQRMGRKSSQKLQEGIRDSRRRGLARLLHALSIRHVGVRVATVLAERFGSIDALQEADIEQLAEVDEIGPVIAGSVHRFLSSPHGKETIEDLRSVGVVMTHEPSSRAPQNAPLKGKTFVVTGTLARGSRDEIHAWIIRHGGHAASSLSRNTDYLVAGDHPGSKLAKAQSLGVAVIDEAGLAAMVEDRVGGDGQTPLKT